MSALYVSESDPGRSWGAKQPGVVRLDEDPPFPGPERFYFNGETDDGSV